MDRIQWATVFATQAHSGQKRKYTGEDYIVHPIAVAELVRERGGTEDMIIAALLHDTVEDTEVTVIDIEREFGMVVATWVEELTDVFTHEAYPEWNRARRKKAEAERLGTVSDEAKEIKLCDLMDNTASIVFHDAGGFAPIYLKEKAFLLDRMFRK